MVLAEIFMSFLEGENNVEETARMMFEGFYGKEAPEVAVDLEEDYKTAEQHP